jgi:GNAT superfamily N-acetyltransferase
MSIPGETLIEIEPATTDDIVPAAHVYQAAAEALSDQLRARNPWTNAEARAEDLQQAIRVLSTLHQSDDNSVLVARDEGEVVGLAAVQIQPPHAHIAFFFVQPHAQNKGLGRRLLARVREVIDESGATVTTLASSRDPRAWQRYLRFGLHPGPPQLPFRAEVPLFPIVPPASDVYTVRALGPDEVDLIAALDVEVRGADRRDRLAEWLAGEGGGWLVQDRGSGEPVGYAMVTMGTNCGQIGPVVAQSPAAFPFVLEVALYRAGLVANPHKRPWRIDLSARNTMAITPLLNAGFSAENLVNWFESEPVGYWDRYVFRDEDQL